MLVKFEKKKSYGLNYTKFWTFYKKQNKTGI